MLLVRDAVAPVCLRAVLLALAQRGPVRPSTFTSGDVFFAAGVAVAVRTLLSRPCCGVRGDGSP